MSTNDFEARPEPTYLPPSIRTFSSIEQLDELPRELGWPLEYRQIEPGSFSSTFADLDGDSWFLMEEQSSRSVEVSAAGIEGMIVFALVEGGLATINGQSMTTDVVFVQTPGADCLATLPVGIRVTQIGITHEQFEDVLHVVAPDLSIPIGRVSLLGTAPGQFSYIRRDMRAAILAPSGREASREESVSNILANMIAAASNQGQQPDGCDLHRSGARRALKRAREYIEANLDQTIRIASLCSYSGTTISTLQRIFARELGVTPQQYVMARRLNAVRRYLLAAENANDLRVTNVAQTYGFNHLGRFAGYYRRYFGESPRDTLYAS